MLQKYDAPIAFVDRLHNIGKNQKTRLLLNQLKSISGRVDIPVVLFGNTKSHELLKIDKQAVSRFKPVIIRQNFMPIDKILREKNETKK